MQPAAQLHILVTANTSAATRSLQQVDGQLKTTAASAQRTHSQFKTFAKGAAAGFGIGAATLAASKGVQTFIGFDKAMRNVNSIAQLSETRFKKLSKQVLALAGPTAQAPETLAKGLYDLVSSGFSANEAVQILGKSSRAATAGLTDTATATKAVAAVLNAYRLQASDAGKVSDTLFQTVNLGVLTFEELSQNIGDTLPFAATLKVRLSEVGAATATMTKQGLGAAETFTRIRNLLQALIKPGTDLKDAYKQLGVESGEQLIKQKGLQGALEALIGSTDGSKAAVAKLFPNIRALGGALALTGTNARAAGKDLRGMSDSAGATNRALAEQSKSVAFQLNQVTANLKVFAIQIGTVALPIVNVMVKVLIAWDKILLKLPQAWIAVGTAAVKAAGVIIGAIRPAFRLVARLAGDAFSTMLHGFAQVFEAASHLPFVGNKFDGLAGKTNHLADQIDKWGEKTKKSGRATGNAVGPVDALKASVGRLTGELNHLPSKKSVKVLVDIGFSGLEAGKDLIGGGGGDGWGVEKAIDADVRARAKKAGPGGLLGAGVSGAFNLMGASPILAPFAALGTKFGLSVTSGLRPGSITSSGNVSYHASGHAIDVDAGTASGMLSYAKVMASLFGSRLKELIHTPLGFSIKNGQRVAPYAAADHYDHVHVAMQQGGMMVPGSGSGDKVHMQAMVEPGERLFVLNRNASSALDALGGMNSMFPRFQDGGVVGEAAGSGPVQKTFAKVAKKLSKWKTATLALGEAGYAESGMRDLHYGDASSQGALQLLASTAQRLGVSPHDEEAIASLFFKRGFSGRGGANALTASGLPAHRVAQGVQGSATPSGSNYAAQESKALGWMKRYGLQRGGVVGFQKGGLLDGLNKVYPASSLSNRGATLTENQVRAVAEAWGGLTPPRAYQAMQISKGESAGFHPGIIGDDAAAGYGNTFGIGLWQITRGVQGALGKSWIDSRGGDTGMRNPKNNAEVMSLLSGKGTNWGSWYGTAYLGALQPKMQSVFGTGGAAGTSGHAKAQKRLGSIFTRLRGIDFPATLGPNAKVLKARVTMLTQAALVAGDMASRAEGLGQAVGGKDQSGWLNEQLSHLFELRNVLIDSEKLVETRRDAYTKAILQAHARLRRIADDIQEAAKKRRKLSHDLEVAKQRPKANRRKVGDLQRQIGTIDRNQLARVAERKAINDQLPGWAKDRSTLNTRRGDLLTTLEGVQGPGSPLVRMSTLPAPGVLGGEILQVQLALANAQTRISDTSSATTDNSDALAQLLREANLRTAVSETLFKTLGDFKIPGYPFLGSFEKGGVFLAGEKGPELVHTSAGSGRVYNATDTQQMLQPNVNVSVMLFEGEDKALVDVNGRQVEAEVRRMARNAWRQLPSQGGG